MPPEVYGHNGPYGQQVARNMPSRPAQSQMVRNVPPRQYGPQMARRTNQRVYGGRMGPPMGPQMSSQMAPQMAQRGGVQEYEGAIQYLGTTDKLVKPATLPGRPTASPSNVARRGQPTLAEPPSSEDQESEPREVRRASSRQYTR